MADVFISYSREDRARAEQVARGLSAMGLEAFWDTDIPPGQTWADYIEGKLAQCKAVVVLWSEYSTKSQWVREEARMGRDKSKLIPAMLDASPPPFGFGEVQAANLSTWRGEPSHPEWTRLSAAVRNAVGTPSAPQATQPPPQVQSNVRADPSVVAPPAQEAHSFATQTQSSPVEYVRKCLQLYFNGQGRARRAEYWWWTLFATIVAVVAAALDLSMGLNPYTGLPNSQAISALVGLGLLAPSISVTSRRFHDVGLTGWLVAGFFGVYALGFLLVMSLNPLGQFLALGAGIGAMVIAVMPSKPGPNQYGPNPKGF